ncbi:MAG: COX15/CtaA family protein [Terriglobales bacterium]
MSLKAASPPQFAQAGTIKHRHGFAVYAWVVLAYNVLVILWGTYVRAAGAGNGCGANWPLCDGQFLPAHPKIKMLIEFSHRASSGVDVVLILAMVVGAFWIFPRRHAVRRGAIAAVVFIVTEALLGAALVLFGWVGNNTSPARVSADALHLSNTLCLLACLAATAAWAAGLPALRWRGQRTRLRLGVGLGAIVVTAVCGAMTALADTIFPSRSLSAGLHQDFSGTAALLDRLRVIHPAVAVLAGLYLIWLVLEGLPHPAGAAARRLGYGLIAAVLVQWGCGALDILLLTPIAMQIMHLLTADLLWLTLVLYCLAWWARPGQATLQN